MGIELLGVPGAGKSTLMKYLLDNKKNKDLFTDKCKLNKKKLVKGINRAKDSIFLRCLIKVLLHIPIFALHRLIIRNYKFDLLSSILHENESIELLLDNLISEKAKDKRSIMSKLMSLETFMMRIIYVMTRKSTKGNKHLLIDEGLAQYIFSYMYYYEKIDERTVRNYFMSIPLSDYYIICEIGETENHKRLNYRSKIIPAHQNVKSNDFLIRISNGFRVIKIAKETLQNRGAKVIVLNMEDTLECNNDKVLNFVSNGSIGNG